MPRIARATEPGAVHHVISRFVDRDWRFRDDEERREYLRLLGRALGFSDWRCLAYCLMSNHVHLAMVAGTLSVDSWARKTNAPFARWMNMRHARLGPMFADRPAVYHVPAGREARLLAYIHNNPVRAGVAQRARGCAWSSHHAYLDATLAPSWLCRDEGLCLAGCAEDASKFDELVDGAIDEGWNLPDVDSIRAQIRRRGPYELGTPTLSQPASFAIVARPFVRPAPPILAVVRAVHARLGLSHADARRRYLQGRLSVAKRLTIHAAVCAGITISDAATAVGVSRQRGCQLSRIPLRPGEEQLVREILELLART